MNLHVRRRWRIPAPPGGEAATKGELAGDWGLKAFSLEDEVRADPDPSTPENEAKVYGKTAVPAGTFRLYLKLSPHFGREMPHFDAPGFTLTMIHGANRPEQLQAASGRGAGSSPSAIVRSWWTRSLPNSDSRSSAARPPPSSSRMASRRPGRTLRKRDLEAGNKTLARRLDGWEVAWIPWQNS